MRGENTSIPFFDDVSTTLEEIDLGVLLIHDIGSMPSENHMGTQRQASHVPSLRIQWSCCALAYP